MQSTINTLSLCLSLTLLPLTSLAATAPFQLDHRIQLSGAEGWDYLAVDPSGERLFISRGNHIDVIDLKSEKQVGKIAEAVDGAHGFAFAPSLKKDYLTSGKSAKVVVFDLTSLKVLKEIPAGKKADAIVFDEFTSKVFSFNGEDSTVTIVDAHTDSVLKTIKLDGKPEFAVTHRGLVYFNNEDKHTLEVIDAKAMVVKNTWDLKGCSSPTGLSADFKTRRLFSVCENEIMTITDADTGKQIKTLSIGKGPDASVFDAGLIFSSNGSGTLTVAEEISPNDFKVIQNLETQKGARTMTVNPKTHIAYLMAAKYEALDPKATGARPKIIPGSVELLVVKQSSTTN